jgi:ATP-binding cassette, subfamily B, bacterial
MSTCAGNQSSLIRRLVQQLRPCWPHLTGLFMLSLLAPPLALLTPLPLKIVFDNVIDQHPLPHWLAALVPRAAADSSTGLLVAVIVLIITVALLTQMRESASSVLAAYTGEKLLRAFRARIFRHAQRLSLAYHDSKGTADSTYRIQYDATAINSIAVDGVVPFFAAALTFSAILFATLKINWRLALVALGVSPVVLLLSRVYRRRLRRQAKEVRKIESSAMSLVQEVLGAARIVKAFGQEDRETERFIDKSNQGMWARLRVALMEGSFGILVAVVTASGTAAVVFIGVRSIQAGQLTRGDLLLVLGYLAQLYSPLKTISKKLATMQSHLAGAERAFALLDEAPDVLEHPHARPLKRAHGAMAFRKVCFGYGRERAILHDLTFEVPAGMCLGIAGTTGAGKTTLVNLLTRFYDPTGGEILLDGINLREYQLKDLRDQFAIVLQEPVLFSTSIAENIAYARPGATEAEIVAAATAANAHGFISRLPQGYNTVVGERGMCLSGGERQRVSLARAFLKDAPILILDEPTSAVDLKTEAAIVEAMQRLMDSRTTFLIAHRLSTLRHCDRILRLENGRLVEMGLPESLHVIGASESQPLVEITAWDPVPAAGS